VAANDGVGTKVKIAIETGRHDTIGIDLVAMCVNDIVVQGAEPLFFLTISRRASSRRRLGWRSSGNRGGLPPGGLRLIGGETAEMPGSMPGVITTLRASPWERGARDPAPEALRPGDCADRPPSSGVHSNGFSLVRRIMENAGLPWDARAPFSEDRTLSEGLLEPTRIYVKPLLDALRGGIGIQALCHITGGGFPDNIPRVLPENLGVRLDLDAIPVPPVFGWLARTGGVAEAEMLRTFNCGIGMIAFVAADHAEAALRHLREAGENPYGSARSSRRRAASGFRPPDGWRLHDAPPGRCPDLGSRVNMVSLIEAAQAPDYPATIALVVANRPDAGGLDRARASGIEALAVDHKAYCHPGGLRGGARPRPRRAAHRLVCLAGFMRVLTPWVRGTLGRPHAQHPPVPAAAYRGTHTHERALADGVLVHGCTVHFVVPELDAGPIVAQAAVPWCQGDDPASLAARVLAQEHVIYPRALRQICSGEARLDGGRVLFLSDWDRAGALRSPS
jgi:phosphoribosylaminoimidazole synthetase